MKTLLTIAWRNLWRNKRRTLITAASVFFGVIFSALMNSMQEGSYDSNIRNTVRFYTGHLQIQHQEFWEERTLEHHMQHNTPLLNQVSQLAMVDHLTPRLEYFALASRGSNTKVAQVIGIDPEKEKQVTNLVSNISEGEYLTDSCSGVIIGKILAENLALTIGDTITLTGQGYRFATAAALFPITGIVDFPSAELNKTMIYMTLKNCQEFYSAPDIITSVSVILNDNEFMLQAQQQISPLLKQDQRIMTWKEMMPAMVQQIESDRIGGYMFMMILYGIIMFGILGTIMMMMAERRRELGVMMAVGMQRHQLSWIIIFETLFIGLLGAMAGIAGSIPLIGYYLHHPIPLKGEAAAAMESYGWEPYMFFSADPKIFYTQAIIVFLITAILATYPAIKIYHTQVINALRP